MLKKTMSESEFKELIANQEESTSPNIVELKAKSPEFKTIKEVKKRQVIGGLDAFKETMKQKNGINLKQGI